MNRLRVLSAAGLIAVALFEGYRAMPYLDSVGVPTDGFGNTHQVVLGKKVTVEQALQQLEKNTLTAQEAVNRCVTTYISQQTFDAFVSFTYNVGGNAFCKSTMVRKFNAGDKHAACNELQRWTYAGGKKLPGLVARRERERKMCLEGLQ
jgi:lysozyme